MQTPPIADPPSFQSLDDLPLLQTEEARQVSCGKVSSRLNCSRPAQLDRRRLLKKCASAVAFGIGAGLTGASCQTRAASPAVSDEPNSKVGIIWQRSKSCDTPQKHQAYCDYRSSLHSFGGQLANPIRGLFASAEQVNRVHFGVVVIGSGYGASIVAARLSQHLRTDYRICILERGKEWFPGTFPDRLPDVLRNATSVLTGPTKGMRTQPLGLFDIKMNEEINIFSGNGLGGGSLVNASVALHPYPDVFERPEWPVAINNMEVLRPYYSRVASGLSLTRTPFDQVPKIRARRMAAEQMRDGPDSFSLPPVSVMYDYQQLDQRLKNKQGMVQRPCTLCGDCITGCNMGAKNTLAQNYLPVARHNGTEIYTQVEVQRIEKHPGYYRIHGEYVDDTNQEITRHPIAVNARLVVLGAGSPHSAAILMASQNERFQFSPALGCHWTANGDAVGFVTGLKPGNRIGGFGAYSNGGLPVGPTVQTSLSYRPHAEYSKRLLIQDAAIPRGVSNLFTVLLRDAELNHSSVMLATGHDEGRGRVALKDGRYQILWEGLKESPYRKMVFEEFEKLAKAHGGKYKRLKLFGDQLVTVHPLGGCRMSDDPGRGPLNHLGQVYDFGSKAAWHQSGTAAIHRGLYVADGSIMPTPIGVNPFLTIGALSDRIAHHIVHNPIHRELFEPI